jgi:hypothetical protein
MNEINNDLWELTKFSSFIESMIDQSIVKDNKVKLFNFKSIYDSIDNYILNSTDLAEVLTAPYLSSKVILSRILVIFNNEYYRINLSEMIKNHIRIFNNDFDEELSEKEFYYKGLDACIRILDDKYNTSNPELQYIYNLLTPRYDSKKKGWDSYKHQIYYSKFIYIESPRLGYDHPAILTAWDVLLERNYYVLSPMDVDYLYDKDENDLSDNEKEMLNDAEHVELMLEFF